MSTTALARKLNTTDAVIIGLGSMIGAGIFSAFGPAAKVAGSSLMIGLAIAAVIAYCNAVASAQLAAQYPTSGGTYIYGRERLGHWWGFIAGWGFVVGKTASVTAMALTVASYAVPEPWWLQRVIGIAAVVALAALNYRGVTKTVGLARILLGMTLVCLALVVGGILVFGETSTGNLSTVFDVSDHGLYNILQSAGLLFFAFAGYARIATLGEEVIEPERTIPRAIPIALFLTVILYAIIGVTALLATGADGLASATAPLVQAVTSADVSELSPVVRIGGLVASLGSLLALIAGIGRTSLAMARNGDLPSCLAAVHPTFKVPHHAEIAVAVVVSVVLLFVDLRGAIGFSSFGVLTYYAIANASAITQSGQHRRWPVWLNWLGLIGCIVLVSTLPVESVITGLAVFAVGIAGRAVFLHRTGKTG